MLLGNCVQPRDQDLPQRVALPLGVRAVAVSAGYNHTLILAASGSAYTVGRGGLGQLGHGDREDFLEPRKIEGLTGVCAPVSAGLRRSLAATEDGSVVGFGSNGGDALGLGEDVEHQLTPLQYPDLRLCCA